MLNRINFELHIFGCIAKDYQSRGRRLDPPVLLSFQGDIVLWNLNYNMFVAGYYVHSCYGNKSMTASLVSARANRECHSPLQF